LNSSGPVVRGIMISRCGSLPFFFTVTAASKMAWACISVILGIGDAEAAARAGQAWG